MVLLKIVLNIKNHRILKKNAFQMNALQHRSYKVMAPVPIVDHILEPRKMDKIAALINVLQDKNC